MKADAAEGFCSRRYSDVVPGASDEARRVKIMNANWVAGSDGDDGRVELMIITTDDQRHVASPAPQP